MPVLCLGVSHRSAPVELREALAVDRRTAGQMLADWDRDRSWASGIGEIVLLSTCNRTEIYLASRSPSEPFTTVPSHAAELLLGGLAQSRSLAQNHVYVRSGSEAVRHLCRVAAGLDSMVIGECEVLGQVATAHGQAADAGTTGLILDAVFRAAIRAGRRARAETGISRTPASVASESVHLLEQCLPSPRGEALVVVGTGATARRVVTLMHRRGLGRIHVVGRQRHRAEALARMVNGVAAPWESLPESLREAGAVLSMTSAPGPVITTTLMRRAVTDRKAPGPLVCLDLAMPRDIEPGVGALDQVNLFDLDALGARVADNRRQREAERPGVEAIIEQEVTQFLAWRQGAEMRPVLAAMHARGEEVRRREIEALLRRHPHTDPALRDQLEEFSRSIVAKLLHGPSARLRTETDPAMCRQLLSALQHLYGLQDVEQGTVGDAHR